MCGHDILIFWNLPVPRNLSAPRGFAWFYLGVRIAAAGTTRAGFTRLLCDNLPEMKRMGDHDGDFMEVESRNIWWRG